MYGHLIDRIQVDNSLYHASEKLSDEALVMLSNILPTGYEIGVLKV